MFPFSQSRHPYYKEVAEIAFLAGFLDGDTNIDIHRCCLRRNCGHSQNQRSVRIANANLETVSAVPVDRLNETADVLNEAVRETVGNEVSAKNAFAIAV